MAYVITHNYVGLALECSVKYWYWCDEAVCSEIGKTENQAAGTELVKKLAHFVTQLQDGASLTQ